MTHDLEGEKPGKNFIKDKFILFSSWSSTHHNFEK